MANMIADCDNCGEELEFNFETYNDGGDLCMDYPTHVKCRCGCINKIEVVINVSSKNHKGPLDEDVDVLDLSKDEA